MWAPAGATVPGPGLTQGVWRWLRTEYGDDSVVPATDPSKYTITLQPDGRLGLEARGVELACYEAALLV